MWITWNKRGTLYNTYIMAVSLEKKKSVEYNDFSKIVKH